MTPIELARRLLAGEIVQTGPAAYEFARALVALEALADETWKPGDDEYDDINRESIAESIRRILRGSPPR